jgi:hypothetical protein
VVTWSLLVRVPRAAEAAGCVLTADGRVEIRGSKAALGA